MVIDTLINAVKAWAMRTFATNSDVDAAIAGYESNWDAAKGEPGYIANKPSMSSAIGASGSGPNAEIFNGTEGKTASGDHSHAEGSYTTASGGRSHAEGEGTEASGVCSHAEGYGTVASGKNSHAEGVGTTASGFNAAHAEGIDTIAASSAQHVQGKYNVADDSGEYAHIVGNGTSNSKRSNAHTLDWDGNAWYAGTVEGTAMIVKSPNGTRYQITVSDSGAISATAM